TNAASRSRTRTPRRPVAAAARSRCDGPSSTVNKSKRRRRLPRLPSASAHSRQAAWVFPQNLGRLAQRLKPLVYTQGATGSNPVAHNDRKSKTERDLSVPSDGRKCIRKPENARSIPRKKGRRLHVPIQRRSLVSSAQEIRPGSCHLAGRLWPTQG